MSEPRFPAGWDAERVKRLIDHYEGMPEDDLVAEDEALVILEAEVCGPHHLRLKFSNGVTKRVDLGPLLRGPIFEPLRDPSYFARVELDEDFGAVQWPNGADFAPEALHALADIESGTDRASGSAVVGV